MLGANSKLEQLENSGTPIRVSLIGAGLMGRGIVSQVKIAKGMKLVLLAEHTMEKALYACEQAGIQKEEIRLVNTVSEAEAAIAKGQLALTLDYRIATKIQSTDVVVEASGIPNTGAEIAYDAIMHKKHIVSLTLESDIVVGPILNKLAKQAGVVYTGILGDEPGAVKSLYDFVTASGFEALAVGKSPHNIYDFRCTPEVVHDEAVSKKMSPRMLCSFKDGTKNSAELCTMSNAIGFIPDAPGGHGGQVEPRSTVQEMYKQTLDHFRLKEEGGVLSQYGVVDYMRGLELGVFVIFTTKNKVLKAELNYLNMGDGPNYILWRPYHLCGLEVPLTIYRAVVDQQPVIVPMADQTISETLAVAKKDMKAGEYLDGIGGYTVRGVVYSTEEAKKSNGIPIGLINNQARLLADVKEGDILKADQVALDQTQIIYKLRVLQDTVL